MPDYILTLRDGRTVDLRQAHRDATQTIRCLLRAYKAAMAQNAEEVLAPSPLAARLATYYLNTYGEDTDGEPTG
jgi:hypothetical protein